MNVYKILEWVGFALIIIATIAMITKSFIENEFITTLYEKQELLYSLGMLFWALGYMMTQNEKKKEKEG